MSITADSMESVPTTVDSNARKALLGSALGYAMDGFDLLILGFMLRLISADLGFAPAQGASLVTATLIGAVIGGIVFGMLSDRIGRIRVLTWTIVLFAVFTGMCALAQGYWDLLIYRTIAGIGLGGEFGIGMALVAEAWPAVETRTRVFLCRARMATRRARRGHPDADPAAGHRLARHVRGRHFSGDRGLFHSSVAARAGSVRRANRRRTRRPVCRSDLLVKDAETTKISIGMVFLCSVQNFGYYGVMIWLPNYLSTRFGFGLAQSATWTAVTIAGMAVGIFLFGQVADRIGRRPAFITYMLGAAIMVFVYSKLTDPYRAADRRRGHGPVRQRHARRLWRADERIVSDRGAGHRAERAVQYRTRASAASVRSWSARLRPPMASTPRSRCSLLLYLADIVVFWFLIPDRRGAAADLIAQRRSLRRRRRATKQSVSLVHHGSARR